jgi:ornithine carbamoyltransferase
MLGLRLTFASPPGFELPQRIVDACLAVARDGATIRLTNDPIEAVRHADAIYTDVWASAANTGRVWECDHGQRSRDTRGTRREKRGRRDGQACTGGFRVTTVTSLSRGTRTIVR